MLIFEKNTQRVGGIDLFEEIVHVRLRGPRGVPFRNMHPQGFGRTIFPSIQICDRKYEKGWGHWLNMHHIMTFVLGCKHSKVDQTSAPIYESRGFLGQMPISSSKMLFKIDYFS